LEGLQVVEGLQSIKIAEQDFSEKTIMIYDARKLPGPTVEQREQLVGPHRLVELLARMGT
jgi:hypothetical protein